MIFLKCSALQEKTKGARTMKRSLIASILLSLIAIFLLPFVIDRFVIGNNVPSNISNSDWVGFLGSYIGAIIGALVSLIGIAATIKYTNEQNRIDRELQVRPYCTIRHVHDDKLVGTNRIIGSIPIGCEPQENNGPCYTSILYVKNIGLGTAIEFEFCCDKIDDGRDHYMILMQRNSDTSNRAVNYLQPGEEAAMPIYIYFNFDPISENDFFDSGEGGLSRYDIKPTVLSKYKNFNIVIHIKYHDMYQTLYTQRIILSSNMYVSGKMNEKQAEHRCDLNLTEVTAPIKAV